MNATHHCSFFRQDMIIVDDALSRIIKDQLGPDLTEIYTADWTNMCICHTKYPCTLSLQNAALPRTAALAKQHGIKVFTHESEGVTNRFISTLISEQFGV